MFVGAYRGRVIDQRTRTETIAGATAAHQLLLATAAAMTADDASAPSLLPGWTRGHVLTHLARNADSHVGLFAAAARGEIGDQYPGGVAQRSGDIDAGASRSVIDLVADLRDSIDRLEAAWSTATDGAWAGRARSPLAGEMLMADLPFRRWREVEVHAIAHAATAQIQITLIAPR